MIEADNKRKDIAIFGAGGLGREVACLLRRTINHEQWNLIGFFDDGKRKGETIPNYGVTLGGVSEANSWPTSLSVVIAIGNPSQLKSVRSKITNPNISFPNIIDKSVFFADEISLQMGEGNIIGRECGFSIDNVIGSFNILNTFVITGHDVRIGDFNVIMPGVRISGNVTMGDSNLIGSDSFILQGVKIGEGVTVSPLSALLRNPQNNSTYIGNPAKKFNF